MKFIPTSPADVEKLKMRARVLKRRHKIAHADALDRAAREAKYVHWHHVIKCFKTSDIAARLGSVRFWCDSIIKDALRGETHYVFESDPAIVFVADRGVALALDPLGEGATLLAREGQELPYDATDDHLAWAASYRLTATGLSLDGEVDGALQLTLDVAQLENAISSAKQDVADTRDELNRIFGGGGEPLSPDLIDRLRIAGWRAEDLEDARTHGATYSPSTDSMIYPPLRG